MKKTLSAVLSLMVLGVSVSSCAYRFGSPERRIPGGYHLVAVPVFSNKSQEVSIESFFTQAMIMEVEKSSLARVTSKEESQAILLGEIKEIAYERETEVDRNTKGFGDDPLDPAKKGLPQGTALAKAYRIIATVNVRLVRSSDMAVLWEGSVSGEKRYPAPVITRPTLNTANPLYNHSAKIQNIQLMSQDMMAEAYERLTENF